MSDPAAPPPNRSAEVPFRQLSVLAPADLELQGREIFRVRSCSRSSSWRAPVRVSRIQRRSIRYDRLRPAAVDEPVFPSGSDPVPGG
jgi:hypothetical protein